MTDELNASKTNFSILLCLAVAIMQKSNFAYDDADRLVVSSRPIGISDEILYSIFNEVVLHF